MSCSHLWCEWLLPLHKPAPLCNSGFYRPAMSPDSRSGNPRIHPARCKSSWPSPVPPAQAGCFHTGKQGFFLASVPSPNRQVQSVIRSVKPVFLTRQVLFFLFWLYCLDKMQGSDSKGRDPSTVIDTSPPQHSLQYSPGPRPVPRSCSGQPVRHCPGDNTPAPHGGRRSVYH